MVCSLKESFFRLHTNKKINFKIFEKSTCIFRKDVVTYRSRLETDANIRVWRSLVSRLNGVQEASSSNLDTRTNRDKSELFTSW